MSGALEALASRFTEAADVVRAAESELRAFGVSLRDEGVSFAARQFHIVATDLAVYSVLRRQGVSPQALVGHSLGEIPALCAAGVLDLAQTFAVVAHRVRAIEAGARKGGLVALATDAATAHSLASLVRNDCAVAVINGPKQVVLSVPDEAAATLDRVVAALGLSATRLDAAWPFHGPAMADAATRFREALRGLRASPPSARLDSPMYGPDGWSSPDDVADKLADALVRPVDFAAALGRLRDVDAVVECGARRALTSLASQSHGARFEAFAPLVPDRDPTQTLLDLAARARPGHDHVIERVRALLDEVRSLIESLPAQPAVAQPVIAQPVIAQPVIAQHVIAQPVFAQPAIAQPVIAQVATPTATPTTVNGHSEPSAAEVQARVVSLLQRLTEYPADVFEPEADFEADLGIDSLKQLTVLAEVQREFHLPPRNDLRVKDYNTLSRVVALVMSGLAQRPSHQVV